MNPRRPASDKPWQRLVLAVVGCVLVMAGGTAAAETPRAGGYVTAGGSAWLELGEASAQGQDFRLDSQGPNGHACAFRGRLKGGRVRVDTGEPEACILTVQASAQGLLVGTETLPACRGFCGMRAGFGGEYLWPAAGCSHAALARERLLALRAYEAREYAAAATRWQGLLSRCDSTLSFEQKMAMRNDLAVAQLHLGRHAECRATLAPSLTDEVLAELRRTMEYSPMERELWSRLIDAARHNLRLCSGTPR